MTDVNWKRVAETHLHPTMLAVLRLLEVEPVLSPKQMAERLQQPLGAVSYHVRKLSDEQTIKLVRVEPRRGALEHFYCLPGHRNGNGAA